MDSHASHVLLRPVYHHGRGIHAPARDQRALYGRLYPGDEFVESTKEAVWGNAGPSALQASREKKSKVQTSNWRAGLN